MNADLIEPLRRTLGWLERQVSGDSGALICPDHGVEHTGKSAGLVVLAIELARYAEGAERDRLVELARAQSLRIASRLEREDDSTCFTFRPGRHDPYNCSNSVIDGGACSDALGAMLLEHGEELSADDRAVLERASVLHAQTYLRYAIVDKGVPAQCAWAMTGAAQAFRVSGHEVLRYVCDVGEERIAGRQRGDGSFPYHPVDWGAAHPGAADASAYYQSRVNGFMAFALDRVHGPEEGARRDSTFLRGMDFLHGLVGHNGVKVGGVEAKPWYWGGAYEVASHPFDIAAFAAEWRRTRAPRAARALRASFDAWLRHLGSDGRPGSHGAPGTSEGSYQCPVFWAAHASWIARSLPELDEALGDGVEGRGVDREAEDPPQPSTTHFEDTDLARIECGASTAWIRGRRPPGNYAHGSPVGGGLILIQGHGVEAPATGPRPFGQRPMGAWSGKLGLPNPGRGWRSGKDEVRFSAWLARAEWRRSRSPIRAMGKPWGAVFGAVGAFASAAVSTAFDRSAGLEVQDGGAVRMVGPFAYRSGEIAGGSVERTFEPVGGGLEIRERVLDDGGVRGLGFHLPVGGTLIEKDSKGVRYRLGIATGYPSR